ncbi:MAG: hypothetical protein IKL88_03480 [Erysipelotrichales bacterium]|nr:hypothetical protein [Erysipelotrichales bacterium]
MHTKTIRGVRGFYLSRQYGKVIASRQMEVRVTTDKVGSTISFTSISGEMVGIAVSDKLAAAIIDELGEKKDA